MPMRQINTPDLSRQGSLFVDHMLPERRYLYTPELPSVGLHTPAIQTGRALPCSYQSRKGRETAIGRRKLYGPVGPYFLTIGNSRSAQQCPAECSAH